jgi:hypothetical protein
VRTTSSRPGHAQSPRSKPASAHRIPVAAVAALLGALGWGVPVRGDTGPAPEEAIRFEISPRICSLGANDKQCDTVVHASWNASHEESLCLVLNGRPDVKRCWEHYAAGTYSLELVFAQDLTFQLKDPTLQNTLSSAVLRVIREALMYRQRRRQPWNIFG